MHVLLRALIVVVLTLHAATAAAGSRIWFVDNARATQGDGTLSAPFRTIGDATRAAAGGDVIYVFHGTEPYRESVVLREGQLLAGEGTDISPRGITAPAALPSKAAPPVIEAGTGDAVALASESSVAGMTLRTTNGRALVAVSVKGNVSIARTTIEGNDGVGVSIEQGDAAISFDGSPISATSGSALIVKNRTGGSVAFRNGTTITVTSGTREAVTLYGNWTEFTFADPLHLNTVGARALHIQSSGRVSMWSPGSSVTTRKSAAVEIADTGIAVRLQAVIIDAEGAAVAAAISVENAPGTFRVEGGSIRGAGARAVHIKSSSDVTLHKLVIEKSATGMKSTPPCAHLIGEKDLDCSAAVHLVDAERITLDDVRINGSGQAGIFGDDVRSLTLRGVTIIDAGDEAGEHGIVIRGLHGRSLIEQTTVKRSADRQIFIANRDGDGTLEIRGSRLEGGPRPNGQQGLLVQLAGEAKFSLAIDDSDFVDHFSDAIQVVAEKKSEAKVAVTKSRFARVNSAVNFAASGEGRLAYRIVGNSVTAATAAAINVSMTMAKGLATGTIADNTIGTSGVGGSGAKCGGCSGISVTESRGGDADVTISGNTIQQVDGSGIRLLVNGSAGLRAAVRRNVIREPYDANVLSAIAVQSGSRPADRSRLCVDIADNDIAGIWDPQGDRAAISVINKGSLPVSVVGAAGNAPAAIAGALRVRNKGAAAKATANPAAATTSFSSVASCPEK